MVDWHSTHSPYRPDKWFLMHDKWFLMQTNRFLMQDNRVLMQDKWFLIQDVFLMQDNRFLMPDKLFLMQDKWFLMHGKWFLMQNKWFLCMIFFLFLPYSNISNVWRDFNIVLVLLEYSWPEHVTHIQARETFTRVQHNILQLCLTGYRLYNQSIPTTMIA